MNFPTGLIMHLTMHLTSVPIFQSKGHSLWLLNIINLKNMAHTPCLSKK